MTRNDTQAPDPSTSADDTARQAGRGALALSAAKAFFILFGLVQQVVLFRVMDLGSYGALRSAQSPGNITYNPIVSTGILGMSRITSQAGPGDTASIARGLGVHAVLGSAVALGFWIGAPWLATMLGAPHIALPLQLMSLVILFYGLYAPLIGVFNGQRRFLHQAVLDMAATLLRTIGLVGGALYAVRVSHGSPVTGAVVGFVLSAGIVLLLALLLLRGAPRTGTTAPQDGLIKQHLAFIGPVLVGQIVQNLLLQADLNTLRYFSSRAATAAQRPLTDADPLVGAYTTAQLFSFLPYQLMMGLGFVLFPMLSKAHKDGEAEAIALYVRTGIRVALVVTGLMVSVCAGLPHALINLVFSTQAADLGATPLRALSLGLGAFAVFGAMIMVLNSLQKQWHSMGITALAFALVVALNARLLQGQPFGPNLLVRTAMGTSLALLLVTLVTSVLVKRTAGAVVPLRSVLRVCLAVAACVLVADALPPLGKLLVPVYALFVVGLYLGLLVVLRELGKSDLDGVLDILTRRKRRPA